MKRWLLRIFVFLLLGAIVNVAVAWGCALMAHPGRLSFGERPVLPAEHDRWFSRGPNDCFAQHAPTRVMTATALGSETTIAIAHDELDRSVAQFRHARAGWPMLAWGGESWVCRTMQDRSARGLITVGRTYIDDLGKQRSVVFLPYVPLWPGFAINTVFYAAMLWMLFAGPFALRRWRRIKRGLCPKCGYDLRGRSAGTDACPECGTNATGR
jgi:hypothetical protein